MDDFGEIPYAAVPDYDHIVKRPRSMELISAKLREHSYNMFASFVNDFFEMLNNGNSLSPVNSMVCMLDIYTLIIVLFYF